MSARGVLGALVLLGFLAAPASAGAAVLHDQNSGGNGTGFFSIDDSDSTDFSEVADDFTVPAATEWTIRGIEVTGHYDAGTSGPISSVNVRIYANDFVLPSEGAPLFERLGVIPANGLTGPSFSIPLAEPAPTLPGGAGGTLYWVSVQVNANYPTIVWDWDNREPVDLSAAARDTFATACPDPPVWGLRSQMGCGGQPTVPDQKFSLSDVAPTPPPAPPSGGGGAAPAPPAATPPKKCKKGQKLTKGKCKKKKRKKK